MKQRKNKLMSVSLSGLSVFPRCLEIFGLRCMTLDEPLGRGESLLVGLEAVGHVPTMCQLPPILGSEVW